MAEVQIVQKKDPLDQIIKGLQIAQSGFGIYSDWQRLEAMKASEAKSEEQEKDAAMGVVTPGQKAGLLDKFEVAKDPAQAELVLKERQSDGTLKDLPLMPRRQAAKATAPSYETVTTAEGVFAVNKSNPDDKRRIGGRPLPVREGGSKDGGLGLPQGKQPSAQVAAEVGDAEAAVGTLQVLGRSWSQKASSTGAGLASILPWTDSKQYKDELKQAAQTVGRYLEGGKMTDADVVRYESMLPTPWDTQERAANKLNSLMEKVEAKRQAQISGLQQSGFEVGGYKNLQTSRFDTNSLNAPSGFTGTANAQPAQVRVVSPDGQTGMIPAENVEAAVKRGFKVIK